jgi:hypothetical protein
MINIANLGVQVGVILLFISIFLLVVRKRHFEDGCNFGPVGH